MNNRGPITQKTIAKMLKIDRSTVSLALGNNHRIPQKTRDKVHEMARTLGYKPNPLLADLARKHWKGQKEAEITLGFIGETRGCRIGSSHITFRGAIKQAHELGYKIDFFYLAEYRTSAELQKVLVARGITNLIINGIYRKDISLELDWDKFIAVATHEGVTRFGIHAVVNDHYGNIVRAWKKAVEYGYRRISAVLFDHQTNLIDDELRMAGVMVCQNRLFPNLPAIKPLELDMVKPANGREVNDRINQWINKNRVDALIGFHGGIYHFLSEEKKKSLGFINLHLPDVSNESPGSNRQTDTYLQAGLVDVNEYAGVEAVNLLHMCRKTNQWGVPRRRIEHMVKPIWRDGFTLVPKRQKTRMSAKTGSCQLLES